MLHTSLKTACVCLSHEPLCAAARSNGRADRWRWCAKTMAIDQLPARHPRMRLEEDEEEYAGMLDEVQPIATWSRRQRKRLTSIPALSGTILELSGSKRSTTLRLKGPEALLTEARRHGCH